MVHILLVEDDPHVASAIAELLQSAQHEVTVVREGSRALSATLTHDFDALICDVMLPDIPGIEIIRAFKAQAPHLPVVVVSGADRHEWQKLCEDAGAACFLSKPVDPQELLYEVSLIAKARLTLRVSLIDQDPIHRTRLTKALAAIGCTIASYAGTQDALAAQSASNTTALWVVDATDPQILEFLRSVRTDRVPVFVFGNRRDGVVEETLMRGGAALFLAKPIDIDQLLMQASFLAR